MTVNQYNDSRFQPWILMGPVQRPDATVSASQKGKRYCNQVARSHASRIIGTHIDWFRLQYAVNADFSRGQWGTEEDRLTFLRDGMRNNTRRELSLPVSHPMVMRLMGQASSIAISAKATAVTQYAKLRKEAHKDRAVAMALHAQAGPYMSDATMAVSGYGPDETQASTDADTNYADKYVKADNNIITLQERSNDYEYLKNSNANTVACSGMFSMHCYREGTRLKWEWVNPFELAFDPGVKRSDYQDAEFLMYMPLLNMAQLATRYERTPKDVIEQLCSMANLAPNDSDSRNVALNSKCRVAIDYWHEPMYVKQGYHLVDGVPKLCTLDEPDPDSPTGEIKYKSEDCIEPPKNRYTKDWGDRKWKMGFVEQAWHCAFIPWEYSPFRSGSSMSTDDQAYIMNKETGDTRDVVLSWGPCDAQETLCDMPYKVGLPLKLAAVEYINGYVVAPLTAAISPQRVVNQITSDLTWRMSKAGNVGKWINPVALANTENDTDDVEFAMKEGGLFELDTTSVGGAQNAIGTTDTSLSDSFYKMWGLLPQISGIAQAGTGLYDSTQGKSQGQGQLVGTTELLLQQSDRMMEPFTQCFIHGFKQVHQYDAQAGKMFYAKYGWALQEMVGDEGLEVLMASPEMALEQFRADIEITVNSTQLMAATDTMIIEFLKLQLIDKVTAAKLGGRSYPSDVWDGARKYSEQEYRALQMQQAAQQKQAQAMVLDQQAQDLKRRQDETYNQGFKLMGDKMGFDQKVSQPFAQRAAEAMIPVPSEQQKPAASPGT